ncbi:CsbD family protein [Methanosarcina sp. Z-7115]|uniref:CsbD family protein n=1 Tax=Methanosarcina baikalica TaxID=3073890 RepID=A0ABU2D5K0_9EURY|nr:CsbD family protein [Methanosarcina sp. Z-7115]MDR7667275.1 CsbD family protein [Methanosarcina sp. Z-7115]
MKSSTEDQVEGKLHKAKGEIKETAGKLIKDPDLETEGRVEQTEGKIQEKKGQIKKVFDK